MTRKVITVIAALLVLLSAGSSALATQPNSDGEHKATICHRTASDTNPYVFIEVDVASLDAHFNNLPGHPAKKWKSDVTFRGVAYVKGDLKNDYAAESEADCQDFQATPTPTPSESESTPTPTPSATPTPTPSESESTPTPTPSESESEQPTPVATPSESTSSTETAKATPSEEQSVSVPNTAISAVDDALSVVMLLGFILVFAALGIFALAAIRSLRS